MKLQDLQTCSSIAAHAGVTERVLQLIIESKSSMFTPISMKKRGNRGTRQVYKVHEIAKAIHRKIALWVQDSWTPPTYVNGFLRKRSIVHHARMHLGQQLVVTADIMDFFPSITANQVLSAFLYLGATQEVGLLLTDLCTLDGLLPAGTRCSPIISNVVCRDLDESISQCYTKYSRYADDLAFSGASTSDVPSESTLEKILQRHGFQLRSGSYFEIPRNRLQYVTGLIVNERHGPHVGGQVKRPLRQEVHYIKKFGLESHCKKLGVQDPQKHLQKLLGKLNQIAMVEPEFSRALLHGLPRPEGRFEDQHLFDSDEFDWD